MPSRGTSPEGHTWALLSLSSGNFLAAWLNKEEAEAAFAKIAKADPEALDDLELVEFDAEGMPVGRD